jgi:hypothetical protein
MKEDLSLASGEIQYAERTELSIGHRRGNQVVSCLAIRRKEEVMGWFG